MASAVSQLVKERADLGRAESPRSLTQLPATPKNVLGLRLDLFLITRNLQLTMARQLTRLTLRFSLLFTQRY